jgi:hypothetical protein
MHEGSDEGAPRRVLAAVAHDEVVGARSVDDREEVFLVADERQEPVAERIRAPVIGGGHDAVARPEKDRRAEAHWPENACLGAGSRLDDVSGLRHVWRRKTSSSTLPCRGMGRGEGSVTA